MSMTEFNHEFQENKLKNTLTSGDYSSSFNKIVYDHIDENSDCLDVGCWTGNMGDQLITNKSCVVDGIDFKDDVLKKAKDRGYRNTYNFNLNAENLNFDRIENKYDFIIFADVLEHVINPEYILTELSKKLNDGGHVVISLPNVAFLLNRLNLLFGKWDYKEFGTLDKTHLKFYTIKTGQKFVKSTGLDVEKVLPYNQFGLLRYISPLDTMLPNLLCYQFLIVGKRVQ